MLGGDRRFCDPSEEEIAALTLDGVRDAVTAQFAAGPLELTVVGDFDGAELDELVLTYLGTVALPQPSAAAAAQVASSSASLALTLADVSADSPLRCQRVHIPDSDSRAVAYCVGPAPNRFGWGHPSWTAPPAPPAGVHWSAHPDGVRSHPLFHVITHALLQEVVNSRLFTTVRDVLGLTYDVSFDVSGFDRLHAGWFLLSVTSTPERVDDALAASVRTLRGLATQPVNVRELDRARMTLITRHDADDKNATANEKLVELLMHTQLPGAPHKTAAGAGDVVALYKAVTVDDVMLAYAGLGTAPDQVFTCVGTSGAAEVPPPPPPQAAMFAGDGVPTLPPGLLPPPPVALEQALAALAGSGVVQEMQARYRAMQQDQQQQQQQRGDASP
jgi:hypothetical protein